MAATISQEMMAPIPNAVRPTVSPTEPAIDPIIMKWRGPLPTSPKALRDRLMSIVVKPQPMMQLGEHYVPKPRKRDEPHQARGR